MLGKRLKQIRKEKNLSQKAFAEPLSTSSGYISEVEQGKKTPGSSFLLSLSRVWKISIDWLLTGMGSPYTNIEVEPPVDGPPTASNRVELQHMNLVKGFVDKQRALNIDRELIELEKLDPETFKRVESYIKGTVDTVREVVKKNSPHCIERRLGQRRKAGYPDLMPDGLDRRSGMDRRMAAS